LFVNSDEIDMFLDVMVTLMIIQEYYQHKLMMILKYIILFYM
jgi:hypothetical protein